MLLSPLRRCTDPRSNEQVLVGMKRFDFSLIGFCQSPGVAVGGGHPIRVSGTVGRPSRLPHLGRCLCCSSKGRPSLLAYVPEAQRDGNASQMVASPVSDADVYCFRLSPETRFTERQVAGKVARDGLLTRAGVCVPSTPVAEGLWAPTVQHGRLCSCISQPGGDGCMCASLTPSPSGRCAWTQVRGVPPWV